MKAGTCLCFSVRFSCSSQLYFCSLCTLCNNQRVDRKCRSCRRSERKKKTRVSLISLNRFAPIRRGNRCS
jgi:hypothetical protein